MQSKPQDDDVPERIFEENKEERVQSSRHNDPYRPEKRLLCNYYIDLTNRDHQMRLCQKDKKKLADFLDLLTEDPIRQPFSRLISERRKTINEEFTL